MKKISLILIFLFCLTSTFLPTTAQGMESETKRVAPDVLNEVGGYSDSENYRLYHNFGESVTGVGTSESYIVYEGFFSNETPVLLFTVTPSSLDLGVLSSSSVATQNATLTVSTNAVSGYTTQSYDNTAPGVANGLLSVSDPLRKIADATTPNTYIDNPAAGTEHYGITVIGTHAAAGFNGGAKMTSLDNTTWANLGSYSSFIANDSLTVQFRASINGFSPAAADYQTISTFICTANY